MKNIFVKFFIVCIGLLPASCNDSSKTNTTSSTDTTVTKGDTATTPLPQKDNPSGITSYTNGVNYSFEPTESVIKGKISTEVFYGAPGFGDNPKTDTKEEQFLLVLDTPINVIGPDNPPDDSKETRKKVSRIQLLYNKDSIDMGRYLGSNVLLTGTFFGAHTGHHHTEVLMDVTKIER